MKNLFFAAVAGLLLICQPSAAESSFCIGESSTGFKWNGSDWVVPNFYVNDEEFIVEETDHSETNEPDIFVANGLGNNTPATTVTGVCWFR